jgi:hypothetical protein
MDAIDALKHIQQMVLADRIKQGCKTTICPKCFKHTYTVSPDDKVKVCVDCGYYELTKNGKTQIYEGEGVFALNYKDNGGIFPIEKGNFEACLKDILMVISKKLHTNLDNVDDCVLHSVKNGKVVTIDFKGML